MATKSKITEELKEEYRSMVEIANRRLRRIREYSKKPGYEGITEFSYKNAMEDISKYFGRGKRGFSRKIPTGKNAYKVFQKYYNSVQRFLESKSSTIGDINQIYKKRATKLDAKYNWGLDWRDLAKMFESGMYKKFKADNYDSEQTFQAIATFIKNKDKTLKAKNSIDITWSADPLENAVIGEMFDEHAKDIGRFLREI